MGNNMHIEYLISQLDVSASVSHRVRCSLCPVLGYFTAFFHLMYSAVCSMKKNVRTDAQFTYDTIDLQLYN